MSTDEFAQRCKTATDCLPSARYREHLERLHRDMLCDLRRLADENAKLLNGKSVHPAPAQRPLSDERAEFEAWWEQFKAEHEEWRLADSHALRWAAWQARAQKGTT